MEELVGMGHGRVVVRDDVRRVVKRKPVDSPLASGSAEGMWGLGNKNGGNVKPVKVENEATGGWGFRTEFVGDWNVLEERAKLREAYYGRNDDDSSEDSSFVEDICGEEGQLKLKYGDGGLEDNEVLENDEILQDDGVLECDDKMTEILEQESSICGSIPESPGEEGSTLYDFIEPGELVIHQEKDQILTNLALHQVLTIEGFTGCGKTTQVPQFILDDAERTKVRCNIAVTQPRRIAAISVASRVASERNCRLGGAVGYKVGMNKMTSADTRLTYMTTGVLLELLISKKTLKDWTHIIVDEVHERDLDTDLLLLVIKKIMIDTEDNQTKIILMSATLTPEKFAWYFAHESEWKMPAKNIQVDLPNRYPVKELYFEDSADLVGFKKFDNFHEPKVYPEAYDLSIQIIESLDQAEMLDSSGSCGAVLVFLPGELEIDTMRKLLSEVKNTKNRSKWIVLPLHSKLSNEEQQRVFYPAREGYRKIILATNIAESSITVPDILYVIDFCLTKNMTCDPLTNYNCLRLQWASKNQCIQRRGRCGRVAPGIVHRMVTRRFYNRCDQEACPEMLSRSLESVILRVKMLDVGSPKSVLDLAVDPPDVQNIKGAISNLKEIGALTFKTGDKYDSRDGDLTFVGRVIAVLPVDVRVGRLILLGHAFDCLEETVIIAAGLGVKSLFAYSHNKRLEGYLSKLKCSASSFSDCIAMLNVYRDWWSHHQNKQFIRFRDELHWSKTNCVQLTSLREMRLQIDDLYERLRRFGMLAGVSDRRSDEQMLILKLVIAGGFYPNYFIRKMPTKAEEYQEQIMDAVFGEDPLASVYFNGFPEKQPIVLYKKLIVYYLEHKTCRPCVECEGSKVIVTFDSRGSCLGQLSEGVYRAAKLGKLNKYLSFGIPSLQFAKTLFQERMKDLVSAEYVPAPPQKQMPGLRASNLEVVVTYIVSPSDFFVAEESDLVYASDVSSLIENVRNELTALTKMECQLGQICVTIQQGRYVRARIDGERDNCQQILLFLIDYGLSRWMSRQHAYMIPKGLLSRGIHVEPGRAYQCKLAELRPALRTGYVWCAEALQEFNNFCQQNNGRMVLEIHAVAHGVISAVVKNPLDPYGPSVNANLLEDKYAETCRESRDFQYNWIVRRNVERYEEHALQEIEAQQNKLTETERLIDPPNFKKGSKPESNATLDGPYSPLEMSFAALCSSANNKQVAINDNSVNSVALDQDHENPAAYVLVAGNVMTKQSSGDIMARDTTLMPPIPGLKGLLAMLFCPTLEFRTDEQGTCYTGCVTGLGIDPVWKGSAYSHHDMEIAFDTLIDNADVELINVIRIGMNSVLTGQHSRMETGVRMIQNQLRKDLLSLLDRKRVSRQEIWPKETYCWSLPKDTDTAEYQCPSNRESETVFPLHQPESFANIDEEN